MYVKGVSGRHFLGVRPVFRLTICLATVFLSGVQASSLSFPKVKKYLTKFKHDLCSAVQKRCQLENLGFVSSEIGRKRLGYVIVKDLLHPFWGVFALRKLL